MVIECIFDGNSTSLSIKCWCSFKVAATLIQPEVQQSRGCGFSWFFLLLSHCLSVCPSLRCLGSRRRCCRASRKSEQLRDRSPRWRRHRRNCWRSWTLPGPGWERPATCWLHCRSDIHQNTFFNPILEKHLFAWCISWPVYTVVSDLYHHNNMLNLKT